MAESLFPTIIKNACKKILREVINEIGKKTAVSVFYIIIKIEPNNSATKRKITYTEAIHYVYKYNKILICSSFLLALTIIAYKFATKFFYISIEFSPFIYHYKLIWFTFTGNTNYFLF